MGISALAAGLLIYEGINKGLLFCYQIGILSNKEYE